MLYVDVCSPYANQESEEIGDEIIARLNPTSGEIEEFGDFIFLETLESILTVTIAKEKGLLTPLKIAL
ncbi:MAG UNVERIFIED_CONTAM: DUF2283 domain-containing protein [Microcystis novacekii LVE1205-3]